VLALTIMILRLEVQMPAFTRFGNGSSPCAAARYSLSSLR
jgi:hypothetical protein